MTLDLRRSVVLGLLLLVSAECGKAPSAPTPAPAIVAGNWTGTWQSATFGPFPFYMTLTQDGNAVTGTWFNTTVSGLPDSDGTISGTTTATSFSGSMTVSYCPGYAAGLGG